MLENGQCLVTGLLDDLSNVAGFPYDQQRQAQAFKDVIMSV